MKTPEKYCKILFSTDQHNNHPKLDPVRLAGRTTALIIDNIRRHRPDVLVLGGDWFDRPTSFTSKAGVAILDAMTTILFVADKYNCAVRVLKGTGTHDGVQNNNWIPLAKRLSTLDFKYYDQVDVFSDLGFTILTLPDSTIPNHHKCETHIRAKLAELNLKRVDLMFSHGMFSHHVANAGFKIESHDSDYYNDIIDIVGLNGHVHTPSLYGKIQTGGSSDRDRQGENHPKGIHLITIDREKRTFTSLFIENKEAAIFNSYDITDEDPTIAVDRLRPILDQLHHPDIYIRLHYQPNTPIRAVERSLSELYPNMNFDTVPNDKAVKEQQKKRELELAQEVPEGITPDTLIHLVEEKFGRLNIKFTSEHKEVLEEIENGLSNK